jgi:prolipoprotein diacylglyceryltransferase
MGLMIFIILWILRKKLRVPGYLFCIYLILNGIERFLAETIRINKTYSLFGLQLTQAEIIAVILVILGIAGFFYFKKLQVAFLTQTRKEDETKNGS